MFKSHRKFNSQIISFNTVELNPVYVSTKVALRENTINFEFTVIQYRFQINLKAPFWSNYFSVFSFYAYSENFFFF